MVTTRGSERNARYTTTKLLAPPPLVPSSLVVRIRLPRAGPVENGAKTPSNQSIKPTIRKRRSRSVDVIGSDNTEADDASDSNSGTASNDGERSPVNVMRPRDTVVRVVKARRTPYSTLKKQERDALIKEAQVLEAQADILRQRAGMASVSADVKIQKATQENRVLQDTRRAQLLSLYGMRALISQQLRTQFCAALNTPIRLGSNPVERRKTLLSLRRAKLDIAYRFLEERFRGVDGETRHKEEERWTSSHGDFCAASMDVMLFRGVHSVKQVYDALQFYLVNMEISISEVLGQLTLRDDIDLMDTSISNHRLMSSTAHGLVLELNIAHFGEYYEKYPDHNDEEFAIFTADYVEDDELYPYCPQERVRKNITGAVRIQPLKREPNGQLVVGLQRFGYLSIQKPQFPVSQAALEELEHSVAGWGDVMFKSMQDTLAASM